MRHTGMTLIEILIAMSIGIFLIAFVSEIYIASLHCYALQESLNELQDNAVKAVYFLRSDIKKAGHIGCRKLTPDFNVQTAVAFTISAENKLAGNDTEIIIRYMQYPHHELLSIAPDGTFLYVQKQSHLSKKNILMISDCEHAELFQVAHVSLEGQRKKIIPVHALKNVYSKNAEIGHFVVRKYFVAKTKRHLRHGAPLYSLYMQDLNHQKIEIAEGVNNMQILYSVFNNGELVDVSGGSIRDWSKVVGVAISFDVISFPLKKTWYLYVKL